MGNRAKSVAGICRLIHPTLKGYSRAERCFYRHQYQADEMYRYALDMIHWLKEKGIVMIEQPMPKEQLDDIAWVTGQSPLPVFADESIQRLKDIVGLKDAFTGINIKLMKCTGMREAWKMVTLARALGMKVMVGCMTETSCAISAAAQFSPAVDFADLDGSLLIANDRFKGMEVVKGKITLPDLPGIGVVKI